MIYFNILLLDMHNLEFYLFIIKKITVVFWLNVFLVSV